MNKTAKEVVWYATVCALIFVARILDHMLQGLLTINPAVITQTIAYVCILVRPTFINALGTGAAFGIMSLLTSVIYPTDTTQYFVNPLVSVLPRIMVGAAMWSVYRLIRKIGKKAEIPAISVSCVIATIVNTFLVMTMLFVFMSRNEDLVYIAFLLRASVNFFLEVSIPAVITPAIALGVRKGLKSAYDDCYIKERDIKEKNIEENK